NMHDNLAEHGLSVEKVPLVMQYNKRDLPRVVSVPDLERELNPAGVPFYEAVALKGSGVFDTLKLSCKQVLKTLG
ncbi:MAG TPA: gliding-motility protein MglA, partial [Candidatus Eisenbacteria bacterium]|nr:gliding-motility protein MglA [Candidatus Eisenbacteria bacterium]